MCDAAGLKSKFVPSQPGPNSEARIPPAGINGRSGRQDTLGWRTDLDVGKARVSVGGKVTTTCSENQAKFLAGNFQNSDNRFGSLELAIKGDDRGDL
jgi:hypothetical protein